jgi:hypothetical protein
VSTVIVNQPRAASPPDRPSRPKGRRLTGRVAAIAAAVAAVIGVRVALDHPAHRVPLTTPRPVASRAAAVPENPRLETDWGVKFTRIVMLADNGLLEVRYQVVNPAKSARLHTGGDIQNLPTLIDETRGTRVQPHSLMLHFHHAQTATAGATYSILYGNSGGALHVGDKVTIRMTDGLTLRHVVVST